MHRFVTMSFSLLALLLVSRASQAQAIDPPETADAPNNLVSIWRIIDAFNESDVEAIASHFSDSVSVDRGDGSAMRGADAVVLPIQDFLVAFPDAYVIPVQVLAVGPDKVLLEWILEGTHLETWTPPGRDNPISPTGRTVRFTGGSLVGFDNLGLINRSEVRIDIASLISQVEAGSDSDDHKEAVRDLAERYTAAWNSRNPDSMASHFAENGSLTVNGGAPSDGRKAIADLARSFMTAFPDMQLRMDDLHVQGDRAVYQWTFSGTNTGPGGTGKKVHFSGFEVWQINPDNLIQTSRGYFDSDVYQQQLESGAE